MVQERGHVNGRPSGKKKSADARTERWKDHKVAVRRQYVNAAIRAIERHGSGITVDDVAREAGSAKPKLYRHFTDRADLFAAISAQMSHTVERRVLGSLDLGSAPEPAIRRAVRNCVDLVDIFPRSFEFLLNSEALTRSDGSLRRDGGGIAGSVADMFSKFFRRVNVHPAGSEAIAFALAGSVSATCLWWIDDRTIGKDELVDYLTIHIWGSVDAFLRSKGVVLDPHQPPNFANVPVAQVFLAEPLAGDENNCARVLPLEG